MDDRAWIRASVRGFSRNRIGSVGKNQSGRHACCHGGWYAGETGARDLNPGPKTLPVRDTRSLIWPR
jgi:hypothetical protein